MIYSEIPVGHYTAPSCVPFTSHVAGRRGVGLRGSQRTQGTTRSLRHPLLSYAAADAASKDTENILEEVLRRVDRTDGGAALSKEEQSSVNDLLLKLEAAGKRQQPRPLKNAGIFGNFNVAYTSTQRAPNQDGQPAGGGFRSSLGKRLFQTTRLCQSIIRPDIVTNKVEFRLFGLIRGSVGLRGRLKEVEGDGDTVKVSFEPPRLALGRDIELPIGPESSVVLTTTYLAPHARVGKGSRGSLFVFTKGGPADAADMERVGLGQNSPAGWIFLLAILAGLAKLTQKIWTASTWGRIAAIVPAALFLLLTQAIGRDLLQARSRPATAG